MVNGITPGIATVRKQTVADIVRRLESQQELGRIIKDLPGRPTFVAGGGGGRAQPTPTAPSITKRPTVTIDPRLARADRLKARQQENIRQGRLQNFGFSSVDLSFLRSQQVRDIRQEAIIRGVDIGTPVQEQRFISQLRTETEAEITRPVRPETPAQQVARVTGLQPVRERGRISRFLVPGLPVGFGLGAPGTGQFVGAGGVVRPSDTTQALFEQLEEKGFTKQKIAEFTTFSDENIDKLQITPEQKSRLKRLSDIQENFVIGGLKEIEADPEKIIAIAALSAVAPGALKSLSTLRILNRVPTNIKRKGGAAISKFLTGAYLSNVGLQIAAEPTIELRAQRAGRIAVGEILPFHIGTRFGVKGILKKEVKTELETELAKLPPNKRAAFEDYMKQAEVFGKFEPKAKNIRLDNIESIPDPNAQRIIRKFLRDSKGNVIVGGSAAQTSQVKVQRKLGDMDLYLETGTPNQAAKNLANQLKQAGVERVSNIRGQVTIGGKKSIEFHDINRLFANINEVVPSWKSPTSYIIRTPEGIRIQRIGVQAQRKLVAAFADPKRKATGKFRKDLKDFKVIADRIFKNAELSARGSFFFREKKIKSVEKIFGKAVTRKPVPGKLPPLLLEKKAQVGAFIKPVSVKKPEPAKVLGVGKGISRKVNGKLQFRESNIARRVKAKASQKPFFKPTKKPVLIPPSQPPKKKEVPSQVPFVPLKKEIVSPLTGVPSQPPIKPIVKKAVVGFPSQPPIAPKLFVPAPFRKFAKRPALQEKGAKFPFFSRTSKKQPLKRKDIFPGQGYNVLIKRGSRKGFKKTPTTRGQPRFVKANINALTKNRARDLGAFVTDRTISQTFILKKSKKPIQKPRVKFPGNYFGNTRNKWRGKIRKGIEQPINNRILERRKNAIDSLGEKKGLKVGKEISRLKKRAMRFQPVKFKKLKPLIKLKKKKK